MWHCDSEKWNGSALIGKISIHSWWSLKRSSWSDGQEKKTFSNEWPVSHTRIKFPAVFIQGPQNVWEVSDSIRTESLKFSIPKKIQCCRVSDCLIGALFQRAKKPPDKVFDKNSAVHENLFYPNQEELSIPKTTQYLWIPMDTYLSRFVQYTFLSA